MGKRPFYIIYFTSEYDGYNVQIQYIGHNYKAALERYKTLYDYMIQSEFLDIGIERDRINTELRLPTAQLQPGQSIYSYMNDDNEIWDSLVLTCMTTGKFCRPHDEERYLANHPNAKY